MNTLKSLTCALASACVLSLVSCATTESSQDGKGAAGSPRNILYVCGCGAECKCTTVSTKAGKCGCGHDLKAKKVLKMEGTEALCCECGPKCACTVNATNPTQCGCGKPIARVNLKGTGIYFCNCGGTCVCNTFSATPAKCKCGMDLIKAD